MIGMDVDEFINRVASEPERTVRRTVWVAPDDTLAKAARPGGLRMTEFLSVPGRRSEQRDVRYGHILGAPALPEKVDAWQRQKLQHSLPADLRALIARIDGIHLWANLDTGRSYVGLAPLDEWELARTKMSGGAAGRNPLADRYLAISYHRDGAAFVVLDLESGKYFLMDTAGPDTTSPIASDVAELLGWIWRTRIPPKA